MIYFILRRDLSPYLFLGKGVLKICSRFTGEHSCRTMISIKLQSNFIEIILRHGCSPENSLHIFKHLFLLFLRTTQDGYSDITQNVLSIATFVKTTFEFSENFIAKCRGNAYSFSCRFCDLF